MPLVILLSGDLMSSSRLEGAVRKQSARLAVASSPERALELAADEQARLVLIDLTLGGLDLAVWLPNLREQCGERVAALAYGPHVHEANLQAARQAGCDGVVSRGGLDRKVDELLAGFLA
ncbi:hypothetical protein HG15A2_22030 [Adhaeretor mobilis]|uniref:Response regulatory domain-containing protein n=2 Tax=Adhaeretor mobilis TaxID=1930276 RepID=A0A517MVK6_9BACT|nr:hypothetical protein HG15A2_22030 [Adhaeretor mobilis]